MPIRVFTHDDFNVERLLKAKRGRGISVVLPAHNEQATVGRIVRLVRRNLMGKYPLVDEILVVDDCSTDATAEVAGRAGARVVSTTEVLPQAGIRRGKGEALWKGLFAAQGDIVVYCDADVRNFDPRWVIGLTGPLLGRGKASFVKGFYERPLDGRPRGGGRVTELVARPLIALLFPELSSMFQPLSGEFAAHRSVLEQVPFVGGYGVDIGLLVDVASRFGAAAIAQVDLGRRVHRNRSLEELAPMAMAVLHTALTRAGPGAPATTAAAVLAIPGLAPMEVAFHDRPPLVEVPGYAERAASGAC